MLPSIEQRLAQELSAKPAQVAAVAKAVPTVAAIKPVASTSTKVQPSVKSMPKLT